jgi:hypothetical protein
MDAAGVIANYVMDGNRPLTATTGSETTSYLYGLGVIGEESNAWSYGLTDGMNPSITLRAGTQRQLTDATGEVTYSARYTPCPLAAMRIGMLCEGDTLDAFGTGNFTFGYPRLHSGQALAVSWIRRRACFMWVTDNIMIHRRAGS